MLEIMSPGPEHEAAEFVLSTIVVVAAEELGVEFWPTGHTTFRRSAAERGFEADASFFVGERPEARGAVAIDPTHGPPPDLVIEIDVTHPSLDKLPIYAAFGVPEVWRYTARQVSILLLVDGVYRAAEASGVLPQLTASDLSRLVAASRGRSRLEWLRSLRSWVRSRR